MVTVLCPPSVDGHKAPVVSLDGKTHRQDGIARFNDAQSASYGQQLLFRRHFAAQRRRQTVFHHAGSLVEEFVHRIGKFTLTSGTDKVVPAAA